MAERPAAKPVATQDDGWETVPSNDWETISGPAESAAPPEENALTAIRPHQSDTPVHALEDVFGNIGAGGLGALATMGRISPWGAAADYLMGKPTIYGELENAFRNPKQAGRAALSEGKQILQHPLENIEGAIGAAGAGAMIDPEATLFDKGYGGFQRLTDPTRAYRSPLISQPEAIARSAADVLKPNPAEYRNVVSGLTERAPDIKAYMEKSGVRPRSPLEFAKAAQGAGKEATDFYQKNFIEPNFDAPAGGQTVGQAYKAVSDINDKLRPIYRARTMGEQLTKEAADHMAELERQRDLLNNSIYNSLSERTGLPAEHIQDINRRGAQLQHIGDVSDAAQAMRRAGFGGYTPSGLPIPMGAMDRALQLVKMLRGGPEAVAGRKLGRIFGEVKEPPSEFPSPEALREHQLNYQAQAADAARQNVLAAQARKPAGLGPTPRLEATPQVAPPEYTEEFLQRQRGKAENIGKQRQTAQEAQAARAAREQELFSPARTLQERARALRGGKKTPFDWEKYLKKEK